MTRALSPIQFRLKIEEILSSKDGMEAPDPEVTHIQLDEAMEELLIDLGYGDAIHLIRNTERYYN